MKKVINALLIIALFTFPMSQISAMSSGSSQYQLPQVGSSGSWKSQTSTPTPTQPKQPEIQATQPISTPSWKTQVTPISTPTQPKQPEVQATQPITPSWKKEATPTIPSPAVILDLTHANLKTKTESDKEIEAVLKRMFLEKAPSVTGFTCRQGDYWVYCYENNTYQVTPTRTTENDFKKACGVNKDLVNFIINNIQDATDNQTNKMIIEQKRKALQKLL